MTSIVIAAHNESAVIGRSLDTLLADAAPGEFDVTVVANGCADDTAGVAAARPGVRVVDRPEPGKVAALNSGDAVAVGFPRLYLDADIGLCAADVRALAAAVAPTGPALAAAPRRRLDAAGRPLLVRGYAAVHSRLPALDGALFGRGAVMVSETGRRRFGEFPDVVADDLYLDSLFLPEEKSQVDSVTSVVAMPWRTRDLVRRLVRVRRGNAALRATAEGGTVRRADRLSWLRDVVLPRPWLLPAGACYAGITLAAAVLARRPPRDAATAWGRDESTRTTASATTSTADPGRRSGT
jgi:glycosyltransferase involved in cell wall biosynthesis